MVPASALRSAVALAFKLPPPLLDLAAGRPRPVDGQRLDPAVAAALAARALSGAPRLEALSPQEARADYERQALPFRAAPRPVRAVSELEVPGEAGPIPVRLYTPRRRARPAPLAVYYHGGGGVIGGLDSADNACRFLADEAACLVASVSYRLAPEHPFPAGLTDAIAAYLAIADMAEGFGAAPARLAVAGDSLGANLATTVARELAGRARAPKCQLLFYPGVDLTCSYPSHDTFAEGYLLDKPLIDWFRSHYLSDPALASDPRASPLFAGSLAGVAPAYVATAGFDPLRDEGRAYADRLEQAGALLGYECFQGLVHGFLSAVDTIDAATRATREAAAALAASV